MGRGRAPCCDKSKVKKGPWSPAEDLRLITFIQKHGHGNWRSLPKQAGLLRCGKSCRLRWINYLRPDVKRGNFSREEEETIIKLHESMGNKWSKIASHLPGRTDNEIKNVWNTHLKKKFVMKDANPHSHGDEANKESSITISSSSPSSSSSSFMSYGNQDIDNGLRDEEGQGSVARRPREVCNMAVLEKKQDLLTLVSKQSSPTDDLKEASTSSSSISSYVSNFSNSSQVNVSRTKEEMGSLFDFGGACEVHNQDMSDEVIEIPLESDIDFWNMLDTLDSFQSNEAQVPHEFMAATQSSKFGEEYEREIECRKWLRYLENELGLEGTSDGGHEQDNPPKNAAGQLVAENGCNGIEMILKPEIDQQGMAYFQMWPSSPQNFGI